MTVQGAVPGRPKWRWPSFRLRTLLLAVAVVGLLLWALIVGIPWVIWRYRVTRALEAARTSGPEELWYFDLVGSPREDEFLYLLSDRERVLESLLQTLVSDPDDARRIHAVRTIGAILNAPVPAALRKRLLDRVVELATDGRLSSTLEAKLVDSVAHWVHSTGLDAKQRQAILARVASAPATLRPVWANLLGEVGGREETALLIRLGDTRDVAVVKAVHNSPLMCSYWPGLFPALKRWLDDPEVAPHVLRYAILGQTSEGRNLLLAYATSRRHPVALRRCAVGRLQETVAGIHLLLGAIQSPGSSAVLSAVVEGDPRETLRATLAKLEARNGAMLWSELLDGLDSGYPNRFPSPATALEKSVNEAEAGWREQRRESSLRCLRWITGRADLRTRSEWQEWFATFGPPPLTQRALAELVLAHPEALEDAAILRRIVPNHLGALPADCIPLYERMAREGPPGSRYWACEALLLGTSRVDVAPLVIDLIDQRPVDDRAGRWGPSELLKQRFAENFFGDITAWREWWADYGRKP